MKKKKILIACDGSEYSYFAARKSHELFHDCTREVAFVFVINSAQSSGNADAGIAPHEAELVLKKEAELALDACQKIWGAHNATRFMPHGKPADEILKTAAVFGADLVILGTHGRTGIQHLLMGSVAEAVIKKSTLPVLIVPMKQ